jgi:hypothetical protein
VAVRVITAAGFGAGRVAGYLPARNLEYGLATGEGQALRGYAQ